MPVISTMAAVSGRGYGQFRSISVLPPVVPGTLAIFYISTSGAQTNRYEFATKTMALGTVLKANVLQGTAAGNSTQAMGMGQGNTAMQKYIWASAMTLVGPALTPAISLGAATSSATLAMYHRGRNGNTTALYTYASDTIAEGPASVTSGRYMSAAGNLSQGIFKFGGVATTNRYTYAGSTWAAATALTDAELGGSACGLAEYAIFAVGGMNTKTNRYTFATDVVDVATALTVGMGFGCAAGNDTSGLFVTGADGTSTPRATTSEYVWATSATSAGTSLTIASGYTAGASNGTTGVNL